MADLKVYTDDCGLTAVTVCEVPVRATCMHAYNIYHTVRQHMVHMVHIRVWFYLTRLCDRLLLHGHVVRTANTVEAHATHQRSASRTKGILLIRVL
jgi:hypothetical protein